MENMNTKEVLLATLGVEPQVVTIALDELLRMGFDIKEVVVIYTSNPRVLEALNRIQHEFAANTYPKTTLKLVKVTNKSKEISDFYTQEDLQGLFHTLYTEIKNVRQTNARLHLCLSGGRKVMGILGMVVSQLLFGPQDKAWYLITKGWQPGDERKMHTTDGEQVWLLPVPVLRWDEANTLVHTVAELDDPHEAVLWYERLTQRSQHRRKEEFLNYWLTPALREIVKYTSRGMDNGAIAKVLNKKRQTVANQLCEIYERLEEWLGYPSKKVDRSVLIAEFAPYFSSIGKTGL